MKKFLLGTVGLIALGMAAPALAADLPRKAAPPPAYVAPIYNWTGFYIGANGGWASSRTSLEFFGFEGTSNNATGGLFGGQIGYNWQAGAWVFGLEAQGDWANLTRSYVDPLFPLWTVGTKVDALGLFTGRVGWAVNNALFYVKGGAAVAKNEYFAAFRGLEVFGPSNTRWGGTVGVGFEYGFTPNWSFGVEYMHAFLGNNDYNWVNNNWRYTNVTIKQDIDLVTARINYRFGGPAVTRY